MRRSTSSKGAVPCSPTSYLNSSSAPRRRPRPERTWTRSPRDWCSPPSHRRRASTSSVWPMWTPTSRWTPTRQWTPRSTARSRPSPAPSSPRRSSTSGSWTENTVSKHRWAPSRHAATDDAPQEYYRPDFSRLADNPGEAILRAEAEAVARENHAVVDRYRALNNEEEAQQEGRGVTRRTFVVGAAATVTALATTQFLSTQVSFGATAGGTLIHVFLYGGLDGLSLIAPTDDQYLVDNRPKLLLKPETSIPIAGNFKLTEAFAPCKGMLSAGQ